MASTTKKAGTGATKAAKTDKKTPTKKKPTKKPVKPAETMPETTALTKTVTGAGNKADIKQAPCKYCAGNNIKLCQHQ